MFPKSLRGDDCPELRRIGTNSAIMAALTLLGQITGLAREAITAYFFGATVRADEYISAFQPIDILTSALIFAVPFGFIPFLVSYRHRYGDAASQSAINRVQLGTASCFFLISFFLYREGAWVIHLTSPHLSGAHLEQAIQLWHWMVPAVPMVSLTAFFVAESIAEDRFSLPGANSMILNLSIVVPPLLLWKVLGMKTFALGVLGGFFLQLVAQAWAVLRRRVKRVSRAPIVLPHLWGNAVLSILPVIFLYLLGGSNILIPRRFASELGEGDLAIFTYATRASLPIHLLGVFAISYPYFSTFARAIAAEEIDKAKRLIRSMLRSVILFGLPAFSAVIVLREPIVRILFFRGAFDKHSAESVAITLAFLAPFIVGSLVVDLLGRCLIAMGRTLLACALYGGTLAFSWILVGALHPFGGLKGIAVGWAASFYAGAVLFLIAVNHCVGGHTFAGMSHSLGRIAMSGLAAAGAMAFFSGCLSLGFGTGLLISVASVLLISLAGTAVFVGMAHRLGVSEVVALVDLTRVAQTTFGSWLCRRLAPTVVS
jgi:putative peptidoglycan lipid II flippase